MRERKLTDDQKMRIVQALACFDSPSTVVDAINDEFGITISRQLVATHDPSKLSGKDLATKWRTMFKVTRESFLKQVSEIPISHRAYRLRSLQSMFEKAERMKNYVLAAQLLEQAAKECGDVYTNRAKIDASVKVTARTVIVPAKG